MRLAGTRLIWLDLEMTGLNPDADRIIEIGTVVTDRNLNIVAKGPVFAIYQSDEVLRKMDSWNVKQHTKSGLVERVKASKVDEKIAQDETIAFLKQHVSPGKSPLCGNSICQDRRFLFRYMPQLEAYFHYRNLDVSTLKILAKYWAPKIAKKFKKDSNHLVLSDICDSIEELQFYRDHLFNVNNESS